MRDDNDSIIGMDVSELKTLVRQLLVEWNVDSKVHQKGDLWYDGESIPENRKHRCKEMIESIGKHTGIIAYENMMWKILLAHYAQDDNYSSHSDPRIPLYNSICPFCRKKLLEVDI